MKQNYKQAKLLLLFLFITFFANTNKSNAQCNIANIQQDVNYIWGAQADGTNLSQSFKATCTGILSTLKVLGTQNLSGIKVTIYQGNGVNGTVLGFIDNQSITIVNEIENYTINDFSTFDLSSLNIQINNNEIYTFDFSDGGYAIDTAAEYTDGELNYNNTPMTAYDLIFSLDITNTLNNKIINSEKNTVTTTILKDAILIKGLNTKTNYRIYNVLGEQVLSGIANNNSNINIKNILTGIYFLQIGNQKNIKFVKKE